MARAAGPRVGEASDGEGVAYQVGGVRFLYNDVFRAVHDFFGHVAPGNSFTARGEFMAAWDHCQMYRRNATRCS